MKKIVYESDGAGRNLLFTKPSDVIRDVVSLERKGFHVTLSIEEKQDIRERILHAEIAFKNAQTTHTDPNLLILGPDEYSELEKYISTIAPYFIAGINNELYAKKAVKKTYNGMRIVQAKEPGITVAREGTPS